AIQPGVADDLPSLLSTIAGQIGWPGVVTRGDAPPMAASAVIALWASVWQVRERADLRLVLHWDTQGRLHGEVEYRALDGTVHAPCTLSALVSKLHHLAAHPHASTSPHGLVVVGNRAMEAEDFAAARASYARAVEDLPRHPEAHRNLALALARLGLWEEAVTGMQRAWELAPGDEAVAQEYLAIVTRAGVAAVQAGNTVSAATHFLDILRVWPDEATALANLGNLRVREGRRREARAIFRRFLRRHPQHAVAKEIRLALDALEEEE
ncbi:MAG TPA: tetratricopeptide repeat protein, partial [Armatimonadota bacterium]